MTIEAPKFEDAPGVKIRARRGGTFTAYWVARQDIARAGYQPRVLALWGGTEPGEIDRAIVSERSQALQADMLAFGHDKGIGDFAALFDGTIAGLIYCYTRSKYSPYRKLRYSSKKSYAEILSRLERDRGTERIRGLKGHHMIDWHEEWSKSGVTMAHTLMRMVRQLLGFGVTILDNNECARLSVVLSKQRFKMAPARSVFLTAEMADGICDLAHKKGLHSIALAQAIQFAAMLRQKDILGELVPESEPGPSLAPIWRGKKWQRGIVWSEIDEGLVLRHVTSKRGKLIEIDLSLDPMSLRELTLHRERLGGTFPKFGPVIVSESTGRPWTANHFQTVWRGLADELGIPKTIQQRDTRAGGISEAAAAGAPMEHIRQAATHSNASTTEKYSRNRVGATSNVSKLRVEHRRNKSGTS